MYKRQLEGNVRGTGVHACGNIICRDDITDWVPVSTADDKETGEKMLGQNCLLGGAEAGSIHNGADQPLRDVEQSHHQFQRCV